jgi:RNA-directed DNA polymerase
MENRILKKLLKAGMLDLGKYDYTELGVPQGGVLSPSLANATLDGLEQALSVGTDVFLVRYADDFVVVSKDTQCLELAKKQIEVFLQNRGLSINQEKTRITAIEQGFDFLGFHFREYKDLSRAKLDKKGIFLIKPSKGNVTNICKKITEITRKYPNCKPGSLIMMLNPILRGWAEHYRTVSSRDAFRKVSQHTFLRLKRWVYRKHRNMGKRLALRNRISNKFEPEKHSIIGCSQEQTKEMNQSRCFKLETLRFPNTI